MTNRERPEDHISARESSPSDADHGLLDRALVMQAQLEAVRNILDIHEAAYLPYEKFSTPQGAYAGGSVATARAVRRVLELATQP